ncbi:hypothetical protein SeMB42_g07493 [Synchytrium endobioticum]|nr:hypothetical protein SeMB42_g07493 [Synchytrium endobioticum]
MSYPVLSTPTPSRPQAPAEPETVLQFADDNNGVEVPNNVEPDAINGLEVQDDAESDDDYPYVALPGDDEAIQQLLQAMPPLRIPPADIDDAHREACFGSGWVTYYAYFEPARDDSGAIIAEAFTPDSGLMWTQEVAPLLQDFDEDEDEDDGSSDERGL